MGKFYTVIRNILYIYVTGKDEIISLTDLPPILDLFDAESSWRWNDKMVVCHNVPYDSLRQVEVILEIRGYKRKELGEHLLEQYFAERDERVLLLEEEEEAASITPEAWRAKATMTMLTRLEAAYGEGKLRRDVYIQEKSILQEKLEAYKREEEEIKVEPTPPAPPPLPSPPTPIVTQPPPTFKEAEMSLKERATKFLLKKLRNSFEETPASHRKG